MKKPVIELKAIKYCTFASEETHCFEATMYVDGKRFAYVNNAGHGGSTCISPIKGHYSQVEELNERIKETHPRIFPIETDPPIIQAAFPEGMVMSLNCICNDLIEAYLIEKRLKALLRNHFVAQKPGEEGLFQWKKSKYPEEKFKSFAERKGWDVLNFMPRPKAMDIYTELCVD